MMPHPAAQFKAEHSKLVCWVLAVRETPSALDLFTAGGQDIGDLWDSKLARCGSIICLKMYQSLLAAFAMRCPVPLLEEAILAAGCRQLLQHLLAVLQPCLQLPFLQQYMLIQSACVGSSRFT